MCISTRVFACKLPRLHLASEVQPLVPSMARPCCKKSDILRKGGGVGWGGVKTKMKSDIILWLIENKTPAAAA